MPAFTDAALRQAERRGLPFLFLQPLLEGLGLAFAEAREAPGGRVLPERGQDFLSVKLAPPPAPRAPKR